MNAEYTGKIILINRMQGFGFIECSKLGVNVFFSRYGTTIWDTLEIFDQVRFVKHASTDPIHLGKPIATDIALIDEENIPIEKKYKSFNRWVAKLTAWNGYKGYLEVSTLSKQIFQYHTTLAHCRIEDVHQEDLFVVHPIKSTNPLSEYFSIFAYPLNIETNPEFLQEAWGKNDEQRILDAIEDRLIKTGHTGQLWQMYCYRYLKDLGEADRLQEIVNMTNRFRRWGYEPDLDDLDKAAGGNSSILLSLWILEKTKHFKPDVVSAFFKSTSDEGRDQVLGRADEAYRIRFLTEYGEFLADQGYLSTNTSRLRYLLKTAKGYGDGVWGTVWATVETYLEQLKLEDKIQLWVLGLFKDLDLAKSLNRISLEDTVLWLGIIKRKSNVGESLTKIILDLFLEKTDRSRFDRWYPYFIPVMRAVSSKWPALAASVYPHLRQLLAQDQLLTLSLLGLEEYSEDFPDLQKEGDGHWPMYALVRYVLIRHQQKKITPDEIRRLFLAYEFSADRLLAEIPNLPWSQVLQPCHTQPVVDYEIGYLEDVSQACKLAGFPELRVFGESSLATKIFESAKAMEAFHARLWLNGFVPRTYYDYIGFREPYKKLTREEKRRFVKPSQEMMENIVDMQVVSEIPPCHDYKENGAMRIYQANLKNFHFKLEKYRLKTPNGFTEWKERKGITYGLNFLSGSQDFNKYTIEVWVQENAVVYENGFNQLLNEIIRKKLEGSIIEEGLNITINNKSEPAYTDDLQLQEAILNYLKSNQVPGYPIVLVRPHLFEYEIAEGKKKPPDFYQSVTGIFTLKLKDSYALVWEFYDLNNENATYVFKVISDNYNVLTGRLSGLISLRTGVRAVLNANTLKHADQAEQLELFRKSLGYVGNFKINRGIKGAFKRWESKLKEKFEIPIPEFTEESVWLNLLANIELKDSRRRPDNYSKIRNGAKNLKIAEDDQVKTTTLKQEEVYNSPNNPEYKKEQPDMKKMQELNSLLNTLLTNDITI